MDQIDPKVIPLYSHLSSDPMTSRLFLLVPLCGRFLLCIRLFPPEYSCLFCLFPSDPVYSHWFPFMILGGMMLLYLPPPPTFMGSVVWHHSLPRVASSFHDAAETNRHWKSRLLEQGFGKKEREYSNLFGIGAHLVCASTAHLQTKQSVNPSPPPQYKPSSSSNYPQREGMGDAELKGGLCVPRPSQCSSFALSLGNNGSQHTSKFITSQV